MNSSSAYPVRAIQQDKYTLHLQYKLDGSNAPTWLQGENHNTLAANAPVHNSTGDFTVFLKHPFVALISAAAWIRFASLAGTYPANTKGINADVVYDSGTDVTAAVPKIHIQTWYLATGVPTLADPETYAHVAQVLEIELVVRNSSIAAS